MAGRVPQLEADRDALAPIIEALTAEQTSADATALTIESTINDEEAKIALDDATATLAELDARDTELQGYIKKAKVYLQLGDQTQADSIKRFEAELGENDELRKQAQTAIDDVNKAKEQNAVASGIAADLAKGDDDSIQKVIDAAVPALEGFDADFKVAKEAFDSLNATKTALDKKIATLSSKDLDASTTKGARDIANLEAWTKEVVTLQIKVRAAETKMKQVQKAIATVKESLAKANEAKANKGRSQEELYKEAQEKKRIAEEAAAARAAEQERLKNLQKEMERAAREAAEEERRKKAEAAK